MKLGIKIAVMCCFIACVPSAFSQDDSCDCANGLSMLKMVCKNVIIKYPCKKYLITPETRMQPINSPILIKSVVPIKIHGNVLYEGLYRSHVDTPFYTRDMYSHSVQSYLDVTINEYLPLRIYFTGMFNNSGYLTNVADVNIQYNHTDYNNEIKTRIKNEILKQQKFEQKQLQQLKEEIELEKKRLQYFKASGRLEQLMQDVIREREKNLRNKIKDTALNYNYTLKLDTLQLARKVDPVADSILNVLYQKETLRLPGSIKDSSAYRSYIDFNKKADSIASKIAKLQDNYRELFNEMQQKGGQLLETVNHTSTPLGLKKLVRQFQLPDSVLPKNYNIFSRIRSINIGTSVVDYSELTVKNVSITGFQAEYYNKYYFGVTAGYANYRFRYSGTGESSIPRQNLFIGRAGIGSPDDNHVIITYYTGIKEISNYDAMANRSGSKDSRLMGISIQGRYSLDENNYFITEFAKSSYPYYDAKASEPKLGAIFRASDFTNAAISFKVVSFIPKTQTRFWGNYKYCGINFQSYSFFNTGRSESSWSLKISQYFLKHKLNITAGVKANDFSNPYIGRSFSSSTVFKSIQATLRIPRWPSLSIGYFPSTQLTKLENNVLSENLFYTLTANSAYYFQLNHGIINSSVVYTRFYNGSGDTGFVYFNSINILFANQYSTKKYSSQLNLSYSKNLEYRIWVIEHLMEYNLREWLTIGAGYKYNLQSFNQMGLWGYSGTCRMSIKKLGQLCFSVDKSFIPGYGKVLVPYNTARISYFKTF